MGPWDILSIFNAGIDIAGTALDLASSPDVIHTPTHADGAAVSINEISSDRWLKLSLLTLSVGIAWNGYLKQQDNAPTLDWWVPASMKSGK